MRALPPIVAGHALSVGVVLVTVGLAQIVVPLDALNVIVAAMLISMGCTGLWRHGHPRFGGMQVGFRDLTVWSFLMASAHGAGLMVLPFVMQPPAPLQRRTTVAGHAHASRRFDEPERRGRGRDGDRVHTGVLVVMTLVAWIVYRKLGLGLLRTAWFNLDWAWAVALVATGVVVLLN